MEGNLNPGGLSSYTIVEVIESNGYIVEVKNSKVMKKVLPIAQVNLYFDQEIRPCNKGNKKTNGRWQ